MKGLLMTTLFMCLTIGLLQAQKRQVKSKYLVNAGEFSLSKVDSLLDGVVQSQTIELAGLNLKYPSEVDFKTFYRASPEVALQYVDSAIQFIKLNTQSSTALYQNTQFAIPTLASNNSLMVIYFNYDTYHVFKITQLEQMKKALEKLLATK